MLTSIKGRSVVVTGASKGIGKGIARVFAGQGARSWWWRAALTAAAATAQGTGQRGPQALPPTSPILPACRPWPRRRRKRFGGIDMLVRQCRHLSAGEDRGHEPDEWDQVLGTNLKGTFLSVKACLPYLKKSDQGRVVLTSSITGPITGFPGWAHYGASKSGQLGFMRTACIELAKYGITINAVMPGNIDHRRAGGSGRRLPEDHGRLGAA